MRKIFFCLTYHDSCSLWQLHLPRSFVSMFILVQERDYVLLIKHLAIYQREVDKGELTAINLPLSTQFKFINSKVFHLLPTQTNFLFSETNIPLIPVLEGGGVLPEKLGGGVRPASQNPYPIYDQNLRYFLPYLWPEWPKLRNPIYDLTLKSKPYFRPAL